MKNIYLDNAATSFPKPPGVYEKTFEFLRASAGNPGRGAHYFSASSADVIEKTRRAAARFFGLSDFRRLVFTHNATDSINIALKGLLKPGDHVITSNLDHNSVSRPLEHLATSRQVTVTRIPFDSHGNVHAEQYEHALTPATRLMVLTHGSNVLGSVQALSSFVELAKRAKLPLLLDAAQTAGRIPIRLQDDPILLACSGHKALFGLPGTGILTVPPGIEIEKWREGGSGSTSESLEHPAELPMRLEAGTPNFAGIASLYEGICYLEQKGIDAIHDHEILLAAQLQHFLSADKRFMLHSIDPRVAVIAFNITRVPPEEAAAILDSEFGIAVRSGLHCAGVLHAQLGTLPNGCIRVSPGYFNTLAEIDTLLLSLSKIAEAY